MDYGQGCKPDNFERHNSLKLSFMNIQGFCSNFADCESFLESNSPDILALCETNLDDSVDSGDFSVMGYLPLIQKDTTTQIQVLSTSAKKCRDDFRIFQFAWAIRRQKTAEDSS